PVGAFLAQRIWIARCNLRCRSFAAATSSRERAMSIRSHLHRLPVALICAGCLTPGLAAAVPAFARKTGLACSACHEVWPRLNEFGQLFRDRGYRLGRDRDTPVEQDGSYWPLAMRTTVGYQWLRQTLVPTDGGPVDTQTGTF